MRDDDFYWEGVARGQLLFQQCNECDTVRHPAAPMCPRCQSLGWRAQVASGRGSVCAWIESRHPTRDDASPRIVALIDLPEGVRLVSNLRDVALGDVHEGLAVEVFFEEIGDRVLHQFRPAQTEIAS